MSTLFITDPLDRLDAHIDSSVGLMAASQALGSDVWVCQPEHLVADHGRLLAHAQRITLRPRTPLGDHRWHIDPTWYDEAEHRTIAVADTVSTALMRLEPPVNARYLHTTYLLDLAADAGVRVVNRPGGIREAHEKIVALRFPELCPPTLVAVAPAAISAFVDEHDVVVVKPIDGFAGTDVWLLRRGDPNTASLVESATRQGSRHVIVQRYLSAVTSGNRRLFLVDGEILGAVDRRPSVADFRIGPPVSAAEPNQRDRLIARTVGPFLRRLGIAVAGLDVIDGHLIEVNVTCPGGMHKTDALLGTDHCGAIMRHLFQPTNQPTKERLFT